MTLKTLLIAGLGFALLAGDACAQESLTLRKIRETGIVTIGYRDGSIPFSYLDGRKRPVGYSIDICRRIVDALKTKLDVPNLEIKFLPVTSANRISFITNDTVDLECGSTSNTAERQQKVAFTLTTFVVSSSLVTKKTLDVRTLDDLKGQTVISTAGTTSIAALTDLNRSRDLGMRILVGKDHVEAFLMVVADRAAAFMMDDVLLHGLVASAKNPAEFRIQQAGLAVEPYGIGLRKDDPGFKKIADDTIAGLFKSGEIEKIYRKWFLSPIPPNQINLGLPMNPMLKRMIAAPTDSPDPSAYR